MNDRSEVDSLSLARRVALLTNVDEGVGKATAQALARSGADLALTLNSREHEQRILADIEPFGGRVKAYHLPSPRNPADFVRLARAVMADFGRIDIVVVNSEQRVQWQVDDEDLDEEAIEQQFATNVRSVICLVRAVLKFMPSGGRIIALGASLADRVGTPGLADFAATRAAIAAFCKGAAHDLGPRGITINVVQMGAIESSSAEAPSQFVEAERESTVLKRLGTPEEVANAILFLAGPGASFITGSVLNVDGGYNA